MNSKISFSVMICCYNSEKYISETIDSIIEQTYKNWEIVLVNDGSKDRTKSIVQGYIDSGIPIVYHYQENQGFASARNKGIELSNSEWIAIIDHDDICLPNRLEIQANHIEKNKNAKLFFSNIIHFSVDNPNIRTHFDRINPSKLDLSSGSAMNNLLVYGCFIGTQGVVFHKNTAEKIGSFDTSFRYLVDYDFFIRFGQQYTLSASEQVVAKWRIHEGQTTEALRPLHFFESKKLFKKWFMEKKVSSKTRLFMILNLIKKYFKVLLKVK